ncbi:MAG TPA: ribosome biogenesis GTPase YlqF [Candidatus Tenderia sp.]|nr:ribosome biogenesis GTPase YlqF [Candidatus Tenderia sp.]
MAVNWYPGHMHKARKEMKKAMPQVDLIIEVMDARIPFSSENPAVSELRGQKPCIKILNKADLADPHTTQAWIEFFEQEKGVKAIAMSADQKGQTRPLPALCKKLGPKRNLAISPLRVMIMGIPNVGKSTMINALVGRPIAKVGNEPAVTKKQQRITLGDGIVLSDTPGFLWPRFEDQNSGYRLAVTGAIKNTAIQYEDIALYAADFLLQAYPQRLIQRYRLNELPKDDVALLEVIGSKRGGLRPGGVIDMHKASEVLLHDLRAGSLGRVSMETPEMIKAALAQAEAEAAARIDATGGESPK